MAMGKIAVEAGALADALLHVTTATEVLPAWHPARYEVAPVAQVRGAIVPCRVI